MATDKSLMAIIRASRPSLRNPHDAAAFAVHASFLADGFSLIAVGSRAVSDEPPLDGEEVGIEGWNELDGIYGFVYTKQERGRASTVLVKCLAIGEILAVDAVDLRGERREPKEPLHLELKVKDFVGESVEERRNYGEVYRNLEDLAKRLNVCFFAELKPLVQARSRSRGDEAPGDDVAIGEPALGIPVANQPDPAAGPLYPHVPTSGSSDLYPGPGAGVYPFRGSSSSGDMLVGPNDPRWFGSGEGAGLPGGIHGGVPGLIPGARFDPIGPPGVPGFEPRRFIRDPNRPGGHPDLEHFHDHHDFI